MIPKTIIHLLSGGLDSTILLYDLHTQGHKVHCALFDYGQRHVQELDFAKYHCRRLGAMFSTISIPQLRGSELTDGNGTWVVPARNQVLLSLAVNLALHEGADTITFACNKDDETAFADCTMAFVQAFNMLLMVQQIHVEIIAPYQNKMKWEISDLGRQLGVDMAQTWSCYRGGSEPCGKCEACRKRKEALL